MTPRRFLKWAGAVAAFVVIVLAGMLIRSPRVKADDGDGEESKIQQGFAIAPVYRHRYGECASDLHRDPRRKMYPASVPRESSPDHAVADLSKHDGPRSPRHLRVPERHSLCGGRSRRTGQPLPIRGCTHIQARKSAVEANTTVSATLPTALAAAKKTAAARARASPASAIRKRTQAARSILSSSRLYRLPLQ